MPSRKKSQGKARKAAKAEIAAEATRKKELLESHLQRLQLQDTDSCVHGYEPPVEAAAEFVKHFLHIVGQVLLEGNPHGVATVASREKYPEVWTSDGKMTVVKVLLLAMGTNCILCGDIELARQCASCANYFKAFIEDIFQQSRSMSLEKDKNIELFRGDEHTLVRYYQKHIPCTCLDGKYKEVKSVKKLGFCSNPQCKIPDRMAERSAMLYCQRCKQANYCSRECQVDHWRAGHKERCEELRNEKKAYEKSSQKSS